MPDRHLQRRQLLSLRSLRTTVLIGLAALLSACAGKAPTLPTPDQLGHLPRQVLIDVPFHAQDEFQCGPAALAMVFNHHLIPAEPDDLTTRVYIPAREGSLQIEMVAAAREQNLLAYPLKGNIEALLTELAAGNPVLVMQNLRFGWYPQWHYAVAIGYDLNRDVLILHSGLEQAKHQSLTVFARTWDRADRWARVMLRPTQLPATAEPLAYLKAAADLEQTGRLDPAEQAYRTALSEWPDPPTARFGLGNVLWAKGEREDAVGEFRVLTEEHPEFMPGWNNLIEGLKQLGYRSEAEAARRKAGVEPL
ncbi:PA2778 family cysteine peptidase [Halopseudomonas nanhaiensis]|uniref:PA2778 family cysteine peptidase n=1 Tax=Halopseudomonas nanhaiensis TaxID=2830842 RepID=UPI001CC01E8F|nr:PA2778 family cysteine peptidase [Halopseudomonas nanhaiensis]UAW99512.1 PA2778 family cysteine peptidase [Halopseudomonas nanhaiensis]